MKDSISIDRIANAIILRKNKFDNFILVEGSHDRLFFLKFKQENTQIEITFGWEKLIGIISILKERGFNKVIGVIDRDLREIVPEKMKFDESIVLTDEHDINILCIEKSFETIFRSYSSEAKVDKFKTDKNIECLKLYTHELLKPLSFLKVLNKRENLNLSFKANEKFKKNLDYSKFINPSEYDFISMEKLVETVTNYSRNRSREMILSDEIILNKLRTVLDNEDYAYSKLNCGHDFGHLICLGLKKALATKVIDGEVFLKENLLNYEYGNFVSTNLFKSIMNLEINQSTQYLKN